MTSTPALPTPKPVVTIYGTFGAGAKQVGRGVARHLGLPYFGPAFSSEALEGGPEDVREEEALFLKKMVAVLAAAFGAAVTPNDGGVQRHKQELIEENIRQVQGCAHLGGVLVGRHGALLLADRPNTVHVLLTGSIEDRIERAAAESGITREHAARRLAREDHVRADMAIALFGWDPRTPDRYDLVINTSRIPLDGVVEAILAAVRAMPD
jgi:Cytidylate kinase-like family